jgi:pimeloyl-ACP methyl ester carboxylesterase
MGRPLLVCLAIGVLSLPAGARGQPSSSHRQFVASDGVHIHYLTRGAGPALLLLHGFALNADLNWVRTAALDSLATVFTVIAPDLRGHGGSDKPHDPSAYGARFVADMVELLDHLHIEKAHVAGYSMGGIIALKLIATHPERVRSAVLAGTGWQRPGGTTPPYIESWIAKLETAAREHTSIAEALRLPDQPPLPAPVVVMLDSNDAAALVAVLRSASGLDVSEREIRSLTTPVHVVVGEADRGALVLVDALTQINPGVGVTTVPGADHRRTLSDPLVARTIRTFASAH